MSFQGLLAAAQYTVSDPDYNARYDGTRQLPQIGISIPPSVRALETVVNYSRLVVDTMAEVLTVDGFEGSDIPDDSIRNIWTVWQSNNMKTKSRLAHTEALTQGVAYALVGITPAGRVKTSVLPMDGVAVTEGEHGGIAEAVIAFSEGTAYGTTVNKAAYYTPQTVEVFQEAYGSWTLISRQRGCGMVPLVALENKTRILDKAGRSEMDLVSPYADAASRSFTLLQLATEILSMPQRYILGGDMSKFKKKDGSQATQEELYMGSYIMSPDASTKVGQLDGANLEQVIAVLEHCARMVSSLTGIPLAMLGISAGNPESAEAMRAAKERMITRGELKQDLFGDTWEQWARIVLAMSGWSLEGSETLSTVWRDIALPSASSKSAYLLQAHAQGLISGRTAREGLPLTTEQKAIENKALDVADSLGVSGEMRML